VPHGNVKLHTTVLAQHRNNNKITLKNNALLSPDFIAEEVNKTLFLKLHKIKSTRKRRATSSTPDSYLIKLWHT